MRSSSISRLQRKGYLLRDCQRLVNNDRNVYAACMVAMGHADGMVTGVTRNWYTAYEDVRKVLDARPRPARHRRVDRADPRPRRAGRRRRVTTCRMARTLADIAEEAVRVARRLGIEPRVALLAYSTFGHPRGERSDRVREAVSLLDKRQVDFEYDGDMAADVALNREAMKQYPFCRLSDTANVLIMPAFHSASISTKMLKELGGATLIGPMLVGLDALGADLPARRQGQRRRQHGGAGGLRRQRVIGDTIPPAADLSPAADGSQRLPVRLRKKQGDEEHENAGRQGVKGNADRNRQAQRGNDAHRPHRAQQPAEPRVEGLPPVEGIGREQVEA